MSSAVATDAASASQTAKQDPTIEKMAVQDIEKDSESVATVEGSNTQKKSDTDPELAEEPTPSAELVDWDGESDPHKPMNWTTTRKAKNIVVICYLTFLTLVHSIHSTFNMSIANNVTNLTKAPRLNYVRSCNAASNARFQLQLEPVSLLHSKHLGTGILLRTAYHSAHV
jgi:hypothetical protein